MSDSGDVSTGFDPKHQSNDAPGTTANTRRSCNNCRQQKLKCDVIQSPFKPCSRCHRLRKECRVEREFKRVEKRDKYASMQREIDELRRQLKAATQSNTTDVAQLHSSNTAPEILKSATTLRKLGDNELSSEKLDKLHNEYFSHYHQYLPVLDPSLDINHYFNLSPILGWTIIIVASRRFEASSSLLEELSPSYLKLLWSVIADQLQPFHVVKALCLLCTWPLPSNTNPSDTTYTFCSMMVSFALQSALDFPVILQISKKTMSESERRDRMVTWAACNVVAQYTSTSFGLPLQANFDRVLGADDHSWSPYHIPAELQDHLRIGKLYAKVGKLLYGHASDVNGLPPEGERAAIYKHVRTLYTDLATTLSLATTPTSPLSERGGGLSYPTILELHLLAAAVHLNAFAFLLPRKTPAHETGLLNMYNASNTYIQTLISHEATHGSTLPYLPNILLSALFSSIFALLKLVNSSFANTHDVSAGKASYNAALVALPSMSLRKEDICARSAVRIPQLVRDVFDGYWKGTGLDLLELKIQTRMNFCHAYDCMWHWLVARRYEEAKAAEREQARDQGEDDGMVGQMQGMNTSSSMVMPEFALHAGLAAEGYDLFNSMEWLLEDLPVELYNFGN